MKKDNDIRVNLYRVMDDLAFFVQVDYMDKNAEEQTGLILLDTGSDLNFISQEVADCIGIDSKQESESTSIQTISGKVTVYKTRFSFVFGGVQFHENFFINDGHLPQIYGEIPVIGILGHKFMQRHRLVLNYSNFTLHTSHTSLEKLAISDCDFFFSMDMGLKYYGVPILCVGQGDMKIVAVADSGATDNVISAPTLSNKGFQCEYLGSSDTIQGLNDSVETKEAILNYNLLTLVDGGERTVHHKDIFKVHPHYLFEPEEGECDENGQQLPPIAALIGSPFMAKQGWILDFGAKIIYRRKTMEVLKEAV